MTTPARKLKPFRQGDFDGLCGIYAIVNVIRLAAGPTDRISDGAAERLFNYLIDKTHRRIGLERALTEGITTPELAWLLKKASRFLVRHRMTELHWHRLAISRRQSSIDQFRGLIVNALAKPRTGLVIRLTGTYDHWSVVSGVTRDHLSLFDSSEMVRIKLDRCRIHTEARTHHRTDYAIRAGSVFAVMAAKIVRPPK